MQAVLDDVLALRDALERAYEHPADREGPRSITYAGGRFAVSEVQGWLRLSDEEARAGDINRILWTGALLYSDIAMRVSSDDRAVVGRSRAVRLRDGQLDGYEYAAGPIWEFARALLDQIRPDPSRDPVVGLWYKATVASLLNGQAVLSDAAAQLDRGRRLFPSDPDLLFYSGCLHENYTAESLREAGRSVVLPPGETIALGPVRSHLRDAEGYFRKALSANAQFAEARLRLGRVLGLLQRHEEAAAELTQAMSGLREPRLVYYAQMFLGREHQALGHRDAAREWYERAAATFPEVQSPLLALSQLALQSNDRDGSMQAVGRLTRLPADEADDPWPGYYVTTGRRAGALLAQLLAAVPPFSRR